MHAIETIDIQCQPNEVASNRLGTCRTSYEGIKFSSADEVHEILMKNTSAFDIMHAGEPVKE
jgi:hypothetical protein